MHALQERLYSWLGGLRASDICGGVIHKLSESGLASQQRMKLEALRVSALPVCLRSHAWHAIVVI